MELASWKSPSAIKARIDAIQDLMRDVLKPATKETGWDGDYGVIPGTDKKTLLKSGSEQILAMFQIAVEPIIEDLSTDDCFRYRVTVRLTNAQTEAFLGAGVGECSTNETKYKWKQTYSKPEWESYPPDRRKMKYSQYKDGDGAWKDGTPKMLIRTEPADLANTCLKMAKKRAQIDATLTVTGASSMFTQDLEDDDKDDSETKGKQQDNRGSRGRASNQHRQAPREDVKCAQCGAINGHLPSCVHHPNNKGKQSSTGQEATSQKPTTNEAQKQEAAADQAPKEDHKTEKETYEFYCRVDKLVPGVTPVKKTAYVDVHVTDNEGNPGTLTCWSTTIQGSLKNLVKKVALLKVSHKVVNGRDFYQVDQIISGDGFKYVDNLPTEEKYGEELAPDANTVEGEVLPDDKW